MALLFLIVRRTEPSRFTYLRHVYASETVEVILDRRLQERRRVRLHERAAAERRHENRRQRDITKDLQTYGWAVARRPGTSALLGELTTPRPRRESEAMSEEANCLIIVPQDQPELYDRLRAHFSQRPNIQVRLEARTGERATNDLDVFAVGGGSLRPDLRAHVEAEIRSLCGR